MSLYGIHDIASQEARQAYAEIEAKGHRGALLARLRRNSDAERQRRLEERKHERRLISIEQLPVDKASCNRPASSVRKEILLQTLENHNVNIDELLSPRRLHKLVVARHELYARLKQFTRMSYPQIGRFCGDRDHTTILHGVRKFEQARAAE
jgi:hypothetical protein